MVNESITIERPGTKTPDIHFAPNQDVDSEVDHSLDDLFNTEENKYYIASHPSGRHACYCGRRALGEYGLALTSSEALMYRFLEHVNCVHNVTNTQITESKEMLFGYEIIKVSFDDAMEVLRSKTSLLRHLILVDSIQNPKIIAER